MNQLLAPRQCTPDDLLLIPESHRFELIDGHLVERHMGAKSSAAALRIIGRVDIFVGTHQLGHAFGSDCGFQICNRSPHF